VSDLAEELLRKAKASGLKITCAESCTGGMISAAITDIAGSSAIFEHGFVTYSNGAKQSMLGVSQKTLADHGAVSEPVARQMAKRRNAASTGRYCNISQWHRRARRI
jgi:nicotinamide-nucleotide amidase